MVKKWKKPGAGEKRSEGDPKPSDNCRYNPASVQAVAIKEAPDDKQWKTDQKGFWTKQISRATRLNIITAIGVLFTGIAAGGALLYAWITYSQFQDAHNNFIVDQRAWVAPSNGGGFNERGDFLIKNFGKTPALDVTDQLETVHDDKLIPDISAWMDKHPFRQSPLNVGFLMPGQETAVSGGPGGGFDKPINNPYVANGTVILYMVGKVTYRTFGKVHTTKWCGMWVPAANAFDTGNGCETWIHTD